MHHGHQNRNLGTHLRHFLHNTPENWSTQVHMYAYAHNSQPLSELNLSPYEIVFHTIPRIPINFELNLQRDTYRNCTSQYCQELPLHTHYDKSNLNPFFHKILSKPIPQWILATETAMIQIYHTVYENTKRKINSYAYFNKTYHNPRPLDIGTFVLKRNFLHVHFSDKLKPLRIGPFKIINKISDITYEIVNQDGYTSHIHRNYPIPYHPKEPVIFPFLQQYNPHLFNDCHSNINEKIINSDEDKLTDDEQFPSTTSNKETDIPFTIDLHPESFSQYSSFPYKQREQIPQNTYLDNQSDIHDYDNFRIRITSGFETASLLSEEPATISDSAANFSRVYSHSSIASNSSIQLPEYFLEDFSRPPSPNPHEYPIRVNSKIVRTLNEDPRYTVLPARFINNSSLSTQRTQRELRRLQEQQLILKFEVEVTFNSLGPHPFSLSTRVAHKTTPSPFIVTSISYLCDADLPEIRTGHINFFNPYSGLNYRTIF